jgi:fumarate hydratase subunit beta
MMDLLQEVEIPFAEGVVESLQAGDLISLTGTLFTGRDQTHRRMMALLDDGADLPVDLAGQLL